MEAWMSCSLSVSRLLVASSRIRICGEARIARAMASRCCWPPESFTPRSPIRVSYLSGSLAMNSWALARRAASSISLVGGVVAAVGDVVAHRAVEQKHVLLDDGQQIAVGAEAKVANVGAVEQDAAACGVVKARHEVGDGRLARAAAADQGNDRSAGDDDVEVVHDRAALAIFEVNVFKTDFVHNARGVDGVGRSGLSSGMASTSNTRSMAASER